ncbi:hypothetical protein AOQ84DRAFT_354321 [Glonium stellatum]|uniref:Borealin N-terminal domain-containing protein n=1 Tax=Glonium stellatum TaxID=574774 RepID=A0A8E2F1X6_9PEZI|nr:hypothetical protein AOQ84DRAFT_354321 [Glonium stellatum]
MAPLRTRKQKSPQPEISSFAAPFKTVTMKSPSPVRTPDKSPKRRKAAITQAQKQALIDNLRLEITERARKLRAQYSLHTQGLRSRLEIRVNRIPQALRTTNIMDLINKYSEQTNPTRPTAPVTSKHHVAGVVRPAIVHKPASNELASSVRPRGTKRPSNEMASDKENTHADHELMMPKKRVKATITASQGPVAANSRATRTASRNIAPSQVLSPKSNNSRTLPRSPFKSSGAMSPQKSYLARPTSPLKPSVPIVPIVEKPVAPSRQARGGPTAVPSAATARGRGAAAAAAAANAKHTGQARAARTARATTGKAVAAGATGRRVAAAKAVKESAVSTASTATGTGGRVLRARR